MKKNVILFDDFSFLGENDLIMNKVICILGPTATGKTDLSLALAEQLSGEIISVDSAMVYRGMDIGTAKPTEQERRGIAHHLIDIIEPEQTYSAAAFCQDAKRLITEIIERERTPILAGGTMMYFNALFNGLSDLPSADPDIRAQIAARAELLGWPALHTQLAQIDPDAAVRINPNDQQRISRAIEVYEITGDNITNLCKPNAIPPLSVPTLKIALVPKNRAILHQRIKLRFEMMLKNGFLDEVKQLYSRPYLKAEMPSMRCVGYRQVWQLLDEEFGYDVMLDRGIIATRQLAKRQMTWLRGMAGLQHFHFDDAGLQQQVIDWVTNQPTTK